MKLTGTPWSWPTYLRLTCRARRQGSILYVRATVKFIGFVQQCENAVSGCCRPSSEECCWLCCQVTKLSGDCSVQKPGLHTALHAALHTWFVEIPWQRENAESWNAHWWWQTEEMIVRMSGEESDATMAATLASGWALTVSCLRKSDQDGRLRWALASLMWWNVVGGRCPWDSKGLSVLAKKTFEDVENCFAWWRRTTTI